MSIAGHSGSFGGAVEFYDVIILSRNRVITGLVPVRRSLVVTAYVPCRTMRE